MASQQQRQPRRAVRPVRQGQADTSPGWRRVGSVTELAHLGKINLRGGEDILPGVKKHTGCKALPENNRTVTVGERTLVWLAPDEFLVLCEAGEEAGFTAS